MSARERYARHVKAWELGKKAYAEGKPQTANPYKRGPWSSHVPWECGWNDAWNKDGCPSSRIEAPRHHPAPGGDV